MFIKIFKVVFFEEGVFKASGVEVIVLATIGELKNIFKFKIGEFRKIIEVEKSFESPFGQKI